MAPSVVLLGPLLWLLCVTVAGEPSIIGGEAVSLGPLACDVGAHGLALRAGTICEAAIYNAAGLLTTVTSDKVVFSEKNAVGEFKFHSGNGRLLFLYQAPADFPASASPPREFTLFVQLTTSAAVVGNRQSLTLQLLYPDVRSTAEASVVRCNDGVYPIVCTIAAADPMGPVRFDIDDYAIILKGWNSTSKGWFDRTDAFHWDVVVTDPQRADVAHLSWRLKVNNAVSPHQLHVHAEDSALRREILGSPYAFTSGVVPTAASVTFRGCAVTTLSSRERTTCVAELRDGVSGDGRYFRFNSTQQALFTDLHYIPSSETVRPSTLPRIQITYVAPIVYSPVEDRLSLIVNDVLVNEVPVGISLRPLNAVDESGGERAAIVAVGLLFYGGVLGLGFFLIARRIHLVRVIRRERAAKEQRETSARGGVTIVSNAPVDQDRQHVDCD